MVQASSDPRFRSVPSRSTLGPRIVLRVVSRGAFRSYLGIYYPGEAPIEFDVPPRLTHLLLALVWVANKASYSGRFASASEIGALYGEMPGARGPVDQDTVPHYVAAVRKLVKDAVLERSPARKVPDLIETGVEAGYRIGKFGLEVHFSD